MLRILKIDCINRIKYEKPEEFKSSLFVDVYAKAIKLANVIIEDNIRLEKSDTIDNDFCTEERFNNIISFWGERGMGKSSAMLSFALFLKNYRKNGSTPEKQFDFSNLKKKELVFHVLPRIDATMLTESDSLLDVVLAKMWESFDEKFQDNGNGNGCANITKRSFSDVKKSYSSYRKPISDDEKFSITSIRELKELSKCLNLQADLKRLVSSYLSCMEEGGEKFLVLAIDDLDMEMGNIYSTLEQVRLFLMIPKVIVLVTADYDRLYLDCNKSISEHLICDAIILEQEKRKIRSQTEKYLAKIFPGNMRVHMPKINMIGGVDYQVEVSKMKNLKLFKDNGIKIDEKKVLFMILAKYTGIMLYPFYNHRHILQKNSLRTIVNELYELDSMYSFNSQERFEVACKWIQDALVEYGRMIVDVEIYDVIQNLLIENWDFVSGGIIETISDTLNLPTIEGRKISGYGQLLCLLLKMRENGQFKELIRFALTLYSVQLARMFHNSSKSERLSEIREIFYPAVEENAKRCRPEQIGTDRLPTNVLQIQLMIPHDVLKRVEENKVSTKEFVGILKECLISNESSIYPIFKLISLGEWNFWEQSENSYIKFEASLDEKKEKEMPDDFSKNNVVEDRKEANSLSEDSEGSDKSAQEQQGSQNSSKDDSPENKKPDKDSQKLSVKVAVSDKGLDDSRVSVEIMLSNALSYEKILKGFLENICMALCKCLGMCNLKDEEKSGQDKKRESHECLKMCKVKENIDIMISSILEEGFFQYNVYREWKECYKVERIEQLLPLQSAEIMFELVANVSSVSPLVSETDLVLRILKLQHQQMDRLILELKKVEKYYAAIFNDRNLYSILLEKYCEKVKPYDIEISPVKQDEGISPNTDIE